MPVQVEPLAELRPDVPQCVGETPRQALASLQNGLFVIYIVPRASPLNRRSGTRHVYPLRLHRRDEACLRAMRRAKRDATCCTRCDAPAPCSIGAMPVPLRRRGSNGIGLTGARARANATMAQRRGPNVYCDEEASVGPGRLHSGRPTGDARRQFLASQGSQGRRAACWRSQRCFSSRYVFSE